MSPNTCCFGDLGTHIVPCMRNVSPICRFIKSPTKEKIGSMLNLAYYGEHGLQPWFVVHPMIAAWWGQLARGSSAWLQRSLLPLHYWMRPTPSITVGNNLCLCVGICIDYAEKKPTVNVNCATRSNFDFLTLNLVNFLTMPAQCQGVLEKSLDFSRKYVWYTNEDLSIVYHEPDNFTSNYIYVSTLYFTFKGDRHPTEPSIQFLRHRIPTR